jgi:hypothetical protein
MRGLAIHDNVHCAIRPDHKFIGGSQGWRSCKQIQKSDKT